MKILLVTPSYFPIVGGSEKLTHDLSIKLGEFDVHVDILTLNMNQKWRPTWKEDITKDGKALVFREPAMAIFPSFLNRVFSPFRINVIPQLGFIEKLRLYDVVHFVGEADLSLPLLAFFIKKPKLLHSVGLFRNGGIYRYYTLVHPFLGKIFSRILPLVADKFIVSSLEEKNLLMNMGLRETKIVILPEGVDTETFKPNLLEKKENLILFVGRIEPIKGLHVLLSALTHIETPLELVIVGPPWNPEYVKEIYKTIQTINNNGFHKVTTLGELNSADLVSWYQKASVVICPFAYETYSNVVREALACGTPVISTGSHILENANDGILISKRNPRDLALQISYLLSKPKVREELGKEGRKVIEKSYSWNIVIQEFVRLYEESFPQK